MPKMLRTAQTVALVALGWGCSAGTDTTGIGTASAGPAGPVGPMEGSSGALPDDGPDNGEAGADAGWSAGAQDSTGSAPPPAADCCVTSDEPGCPDAAVEACVCDLRPTCCNTSWNLQCTGMAIIACDLQCDDGQGTTGAGEGSESTAGDGPGPGDGAMTSHDSGDPMRPGDESSGGAEGPSCGDLAEANGWRLAACEWNGNAACGGQGTPTWDCDYCCEVAS